MRYKNSETDRVIIINDAISLVHVFFISFCDRKISQRFTRSYSIQGLREHKYNDIKVNRFICI